ncbi:MAG TPA: hypothetical protein VLA72_03740, partial [Anaerolineales bacterium]|nr:hypothetical protein [Anaerolineales bacterium]
HASPNVLAEDIIIVVIVGEENDRHYGPEILLFILPNKDIVKIIRTAEGRSVAESEIDFEYLPGNKKAPA